MSNLKNYSDEKSLLSGLLAGKQQAYEALVRQYYHPMRRVAVAIIGDAQAEEVVQDALLAAIRQLHGFEGRSTLKTWLFTIAANQAKSRLRKTRREISIEDFGNIACDENRFTDGGHWLEPHSEWTDNSPESLLSYEDFRRCLDKTIEQLPDMQKAVLSLREYQGLELEDICNILDISASNVRVLIHRARTQVYTMVEHYEETGTC